MNLSERYLHQPAVRCADANRPPMQGMENAKIVRPGYAIEYDSSILAT